MKEKAIQFGKTSVLTGIVSEPQSGKTDASKPAIVLLNSGILHRVGSCRLHVKLARALAEKGFTSLRFDFSGIGDSEQRKDSLAYEESSVVEVREAMDYLAQSRGPKEFILMGLCSGADMAHLVAVQDLRVRGLVFFDAWAYRDKRYWYHYYIKRVFKLSVWRNWATIRFRRLMGDSVGGLRKNESNDSVTYEVPKYVREFPPRERVAAELKEFVRRGIDIFAVFTGGFGEMYNHREQYRGSFHEVKFGNRLRIEFIPAADHIITNLEHQKFVVREVVDWTVAVASAGPLASANESSVPARALAG